MSLYTVCVCVYRFVNVCICKHLSKSPLSPGLLFGQAGRQQHGGVMCVNQKPRAPLRC